MSKFPSFDEGVRLFRRKIMISNVLWWLNVVFSEAIQSDSHLPHGSWLISQLFISCQRNICVQQRKPRVLQSIWMWGLGWCRLLVSTYNHSPLLRVSCQLHMSCNNSLPQSRRSINIDPTQQDTNSAHHSISVLSLLLYSFISKSLLPQVHTHFQSRLAS